MPVSFKSSIYFYNNSFSNNYNSPILATGFFFNVIWFSPMLCTLATKIKKLIYKRIKELKIKRLANSENNIAIAARESMEELFDNI